jgi:hypothetical protein
MKKTIIGMALITVSYANAQKSDRQSIKYEFEMYPLETISKEKVVDINVSLDYLEKAQAALADIEAKKAQAKNEKDEYDKKKLGAKFMEKTLLGNGKPSGVFNSNEFIPTIYESSTLESAININGFTKKEGVGSVVNATFSEFKYTVGANGNSVTYYPNRIGLSINNDKGVNVFNGDLPNNATALTYSGNVNLNAIKSLELEAKNKALANLNTYLNATYGFNLIKDEALFFDIKDKKFEYPDYHQAMQKIETAFISVNNPERQEKFTGVLKECIQIWETNLKALDKADKNAKINKYVAAATTLNLAVAYAWLKDFNKAYDNLEEHKALDEDYDNTYKAVMKFVKNYNDRYTKYNKY